ncbi:hypothetical protein GINT2_002310 [Glugoides intestinalis]
MSRLADTDTDACEDLESTHDSMKEISHSISENKPEEVDSKKELDIDMLLNKFDDYVIRYQNINEKPVTINEKPVTINEKPVTINEKPVTINEKPVTINEKPVTINEKPVTINEPPQTSVNDEFRNVFDHEIVHYDKNDVELKAQSTEDKLYNQLNKKSTDAYEKSKIENEATSKLLSQDYYDRLEEDAKIEKRILKIKRIQEQLDRQKKENEEAARKRMEVMKVPTVDIIPDNNTKKPLPFEESVLNARQQHLKQNSLKAKPLPFEESVLNARQQHLKQNALNSIELIRNVKKENKSIPKESEKMADQSFLQKDDRNHLGMVPFKGVLVGNACFDDISHRSEPERNNFIEPPEVGNAMQPPGSGSVNNSIEVNDDMDNNNLISRNDIDSNKLETTQPLQTVELVEDASITSVILTPIKNEKEIDSQQKILIKDAKHFPIEEKNQNKVPKQSRLNCSEKLKYIEDFFTIDSFLDDPGALIKDLERKRIFKVSVIPKTLQIYLKRKKEMKTGTLRKLWEGVQACDKKGRGYSEKNVEKAFYDWKRAIKAKIRKGIDFIEPDNKGYADSLAKEVLGEYVKELLLQEGSPDNKEELDVSDRKEDEIIYVENQRNRAKVR